MYLEDPHIRPSMIESFLSGGLSPEWGTSIARHCVECIACRERRNLLAWLRYLKGHPIMPATTLAACQCPLQAALKQYHDGNQLPSEERSRIDAHLQTTSCKVCSHFLQVMKYSDQELLSVFDPYKRHSVRI